MRKRKHPRLLINGRICAVCVRYKQQASGNTFPYWYAYWHDENGHLRNKYLGKGDPRLRYPHAEDVAVEVSHA
jgi:hypothetical protein